MPSSEVSVLSLLSVDTFLKGPDPARRVPALQRRGQDLPRQQPHQAGGQDHPRPLFQKVLPQVGG